MSQPSEATRTRDDSARRNVSFVLIVALAVIFAINWGPGSSGCERYGDAAAESVVATVNEKEISSRDFAQQYGQMAQQYRSQGIPADMLKQFGLHKQTIERLVGTELLCQAAEQRGLTVSDDELREQLFKSPDFQKDGVFDQPTYEQIVTQYFRQTPQAFEARLRREMAAQKLLRLVESAVVVSDDEVRSRYDKEGNSAKATFVRFSPTMFSEKVVPPKAADVETWAKAHEAEIAKSYEQEKFRYFVPEKVKARQILLRVEKDASPEKKAEVRAKADAVRKQLTDEKKDFATVAKESSDDTETKDKGGELGLVDRMSLPGAFADVLFALQPQEISKVVESPLGFHIGLVEDKKPPEQKALDSVRTEIANSLWVKEKANELAKAEAVKALATVKKGKTLMELYAPAADAAQKTGFAFAADAKPEAKETGDFNSSSEAIPQMGPAPEVMTKVFDRKEAGLIDEVIASGDGYVLVNVTERKVPSDSEFDTQKEQLKTEALKAKQYEVREAYVKALKQGAKVVQNEAAINRVVEG